MQFLLQFPETIHIVGKQLHFCTVFRGADSGVCHRKLISFAALLTAETSDLISLAQNWQNEQMRFVPQIQKLTLIYLCRSQYPKRL
jgi:hypothetical protein